MRIYIGVCNCGKTKTTAYYGKFIVWSITHKAKGHTVIETERWDSALTDAEVQRKYGKKK